MDIKLEVTLPPAAHNALCRALRLPQARRVHLKCQVAFEPDTRTLAQIIADGWLTELDYMTADQQAECLDRYGFLRSRDQDELADAVEFIALMAK